MITTKTHLVEKDTRTKKNTPVVVEEEEYTSEENLNLPIPGEREANQSKISSFFKKIVPTPKDKGANITFKTKVTKEKEVNNVDKVEHIPLSNRTISQPQLIKKAAAQKPI